ncbi:KEOPS complex subunit Cgi121 [Natrialbaceae archaeon AArc-T1-2]|uniref:KEOPS complex subunit Cgi121 n=1 Tax=Natrialbaceae archaeon AArc-T1-2 TaxID=3053904 RepID=UPI00255B3CC4|nr:KEOPS complex subunit Cgi121 [Natrialbaceae archaeon AArc-T1-2]WIV68543.1 KEOPS complex subunit Cgi121 [Natrialbaceae archaeon AArc-T1-2]
MELLETRVDVDDLDSFLARLDEIGSRHGVTIQAFDARYVADRRHLERAVALADRAVDRGENVARDRAVEILLYAAGRRQIDRALEMGLSPGENRAVILIEGEDEDDALADLDALEAVVDREPTLGEYDEEVLCSFFGITDAERAATDATLEELVRERVALLEVAK